MTEVSKENIAIKSELQANETKIRFIASFVLVFAVAYIFNPNVAFPVILVIDFGLRGFDYSKISLLALLSERVVKGLSLPVKLIYFPPKRFAARIGLVLSTFILVSHFIFEPLAISLSIILAVFAALESFVGYCAGCQVYNVLQIILKKSRAD